MTTATTTTTTTTATTTTTTTTTTTNQTIPLREIFFSFLVYFSLSESLVSPPMSAQIEKSLIVQF